MSLRSYGFTPRVADSLATLGDSTLVPARVAREDRDRYLLLTESGECAGTLAGRFRHASTRRSELPAVGDWVAVRESGDGPAVIAALLPRTSAFVRTAAGRTSHEQVLAANIDTVFVVAGLDCDFNLRRIERYLATAWEGGASPVVVLTKADLADDLDARIAEVEAIAIGVPVRVVCAIEGRGLDALAPWLAPGATVALLGSSGTGKSTLVNALLGESRQETRTVRESDSRGRHTTTARELLVLPGGAVLMDTPGMRLLRLAGDGDGLDEAFADVAELARSCRFGDCQHESEPGCAVRAALDSGALDAERFASWRKLQRELAHLARRTDARARAEELSKWKAISKSLRLHPKFRDRR